MLGWNPLLKSWINGLPGGVSERMKKLIEELFEKMLTPSLQWLRRSGVKVKLCEFLFPISDVI